MTQCRFCKNDIPSDATRCPHRTSFLDGEQHSGAQGEVAYIVDKSLVTFLKFAGAALAIFLTVGLFFHGLNVNQLSKQIEDTHAESQKLDLNIIQAKFELARETDNIKKEVNTDRKSAEDTSKKIDDEQPQRSPGEVTYIVDKGLVTFAKFAAAILAIFLTVGIFFYGLDIKQLTKQMQDTLKQIQDTHVASQKLDLDIKRAQLDLERATADIKEDVESAGASAKEASDTASKMRNFLQEAEQSTQRIQQYEVTLLALPPGAKQPSSPQVSQPISDPGQMERLVDVRLLEILRNVLPNEQYSVLKTEIAAAQGKGLRRQVFDAKVSDDLPGDLVRSEGDAPISDPIANQVYDNLEVIYNFFKEVFDWELLDNKGNTIVVTIHFGHNFNNGFWNGQQVVLGDGDGAIFRNGGFASLSVLAHEIAIAMNQWTAQLAYVGQSGTLVQSFADIMSCLVEQWQNKQAPNEASWLVGADLLAPGVKGVALRSLKEPGSAYDDPTLGKDPQPGHMKDYVQTDEDNRGARTNSGIPNRAFVVAAKAIGGYAWQKPGRIWFEAFRTLKPKSTFQDLANATLDVAKKIYGEQSPESEAVIQSWAAVGITVGPRTQGQRARRRGQPSREREGPRGA